MGAAGVEEGLMDVVATLVANGQPAVLAEPGQSALHYPAVPPQPFTAVYPLCERRGI